MSIYTSVCPCQLLKNNSYPGRGIIVGKTPDGEHAAVAYFIMGRSENSRNRVFVEGKDGAIFTEPYDETKVKDPSLIIYAPIRVYKNRLIVTNGDQTDTVFEGHQKGLSFSESLSSRCFEPDAPNFTPRISAELTFSDGDFTYEMSILKSADETGSACSRYTFSFSPLSGIGHFLHTYNADGNPLPTFTGEPERITVKDSIDEFAALLWDNLDENNKISLYVRYVSLNDGKVDNRLINRFKK